MADTAHHSVSIGPNTTEHSITMPCQTHLFLESAPMIASGALRLYIIFVIGHYIGWLFTARSHQLLQAAGVLDSELPYRSPAKAGQVAAYAEVSSQIVSNRTQVRPRCHLSTKTDQVLPDTINFKSFNLNLHRLQLNALVLAGEFVGRNAGDLLRGICGWRLFNHADELTCGLANLGLRTLHLGFSSGGLSGGIIGIGGKTQADFTLVLLLAMQIKLCQPRHPAQQHGQNSGRHGVECAQVANRALTRDASQPVDGVMRGHTSRFVED